MTWFRGLPQNTKILMALGLLALVVALWYALIFLPSQGQSAIPVTPVQVTPQPGTTPQAGTPSTAPARPLEVVPIPFLVTEAPAQTPDTAQAATPGPTAPGRLRVQAPPNPFAPLIVATPNLPTQATVGTPQPIPTTQARIQVRQPLVPLPTTPAQPGAPRPQIAAPQASAGLPGSLSGGVNTLGGGALPLRLTPLDREVAQTPRGQTPTAQTPSPANPQPQAEQPRNPAPATGLAGYVQEQGIKLAMTTLGPTSVAVFQTKEGYVVVPVGDKIPGTEVLVKTMTANEATLVRGNESLSMKLEGGE